MNDGNQTQEDYALVEHAKSGDRQAYGELVRRHRLGVVNVVYRLCGDPELAEDMAQDAFIRAWQKLDSYRPKAPFRNWLYRIATNLTLDTLRRQKPTVDIADLPLAAAGEGLEAAIQGRERAQQVQAAIQSLPKASRSVLVLREYEGLSYQAISHTLDIPMGTVMSRLNYARKSLAKLLMPTMDKETA